MPTDVLRIQDRFRITGRGPVYLVKHNKGAVIHLGDVFYDLRGHRFKVKGIEMHRICFSELPFDEMPVGILFELIDGVEVQGNILVSRLDSPNFLFCNHPLFSKKVDMDYEAEFLEASQNYNCALFSYEDLEDGKLSLYGENISGLTIYRGWMMSPKMYKEFYNLLEERGIFLINNPQEYEKYHTLPGWYKDFEQITAVSVWEENGNVDNALKMCTELSGSYIVKDYVKSRKHEWYDACYIPNVSDSKNALKIIDNFVKRQGEGLVGGIVLRKYEKLKQIGYHEKSGMPISEEYRIFAYAGEIHTLNNYWNKAQEMNFSEEELEWIDGIITKLRSNFVTIDLARKENGELMIMELGDGQVSGLQEIRDKDFYRRFLR